MAETRGFRLSRTWRRIGLIVHILLSVGLLGAIASFIVLIVVGRSAAPPLSWAAFAAAEQVATVVIIPTALTGWLVGVFQALTTSWGLAKHYWVLIKLLVTTLAVAVLMAKRPLIHLLAAGAAKAGEGAELRSASLQLLVHAGAGFAVLLIPLVLSVMKPAGRSGLAF